MHTPISLLIIPACLLRSAVALPSTAPTVLPEANSTHPRCIPFENPKCCVNMAVCQCNDGIFYSLRDNTNATLCNPPGTVAYDDVSDIPGWCC
ncbi:hypothetical protein PG984_002184 [Apiospora sp. TS-2023a]